jgi:hypothetical protein
VAESVFDQDPDLHAAAEALRKQHAKKPNGNDPSALWPEPDMEIACDDVVTAPPLDQDALPAGWGRWIAEQAEACGVPPDYVAGALIGSASGFLGNARHARATPTWREPPHLWVGLVGVPSAGKSPAVRPLVKAALAIERAGEEAWKRAYSLHGALVEAARLKEADWQDAVRAAHKDKTEPPGRPLAADPPPAPPLPRSHAMDITTEELQRLLADHPRGLIYVRDELAGWLGNLDRYGGKGGDRAFYLEAWNGDSYVVDRVKLHGAPLRIPRTAVAMLGGLTPDKLRKELLEGVSDDGLVARFLWIWPEPAPIAELRDDEAADSAAARRQEVLVRAARRLAGLKMEEDDEGGLAPKFMRFSADAFEQLKVLRRAAIEKARSLRELAAGWHGKQPGRVLRLALVYEMLHWAVSDDDQPPALISADAMERAGRYLDYAAGMFDRVIGGLSIGQADADAALVARAILTKELLEADRDGAFKIHVRKLYRGKGWSWLRDSMRRDDAFQLLSDAGWIRDAAIGTKGRARVAWAVNPGVWKEA